MVAPLQYKYRINPYTARLDTYIDIESGMGVWGEAALYSISSGAVTLPGSGRYLIDTEGSAASDTLSSIQGLSDGDEIMLMPASDTRTVHIKRNIGNIKLSADFPMDSKWDTARLTCDASGYLRESGGQANNG